MAKITKEQYEFALSRIEELLPMVDDNTLANDRNAVELTMMSDVVIDYEKEHYPIGKLAVLEQMQEILAVILVGKVYTEELTHILGHLPECHRALERAGLLHQRVDVMVDVKRP